MLLVHCSATFGQNAGPFRKQVGTAVEFYFEGMSPRSAPAVGAALAGMVARSPAEAECVVEMPGSPILKAQLCAPPKATANRKDPPKPVLCLSSLFVSHCILLFIF